MNEYIGIAMISVGIIYDMFGCLGLVRLPDVYTRLQASTKAVTMGTSLILIGIAVYSGIGATSAKAIICMFFVLLSSPAAAHAIARGAHSSGIRVERVTAEGLIGRTIESELWDIIREGYEFEKDYFDHMLESSPILDLEESMSSHELYRKIAEILGQRVNRPPDIIQAKLIEREKECTTALAPELAIPHIIVEGEKTFEMLIIRTKNGSWFSESSPNVHAIFVLVGTKDKWHLHLRTLAAIATIVQTKNFYAQWLKAEDTGQLRNLLRERSRLRHEKNKGKSTIDNGMPRR